MVLLMMIPVRMSAREVYDGKTEARRSGTRGENKKGRYIPIEFSVAVAVAKLISAASGCFGRSIMECVVFFCIAHCTC